MADRTEYKATNTADVHSIANEIASRHPKSLVLFRGQTNLHPTIRSGRARPGGRVVKEVEHAWTTVAKRMLGLDMSSRVDFGFAKAVLQHYGMVTHFVDLTRDAETAAWFACHRFSTLRMLWAGTALRTIERATYDPIKEGDGYVLALVFDEPNELQHEGRLFDLSVLPGEVLRPHRQSGWLAYDRPPLKSGPTDYWKYTITIQRSSFASELSTSQLFPAPADDRAYKDILSFPYVQVPFFYFPGRDEEREPRASVSVGDSEFKERSRRWCGAQRALDVPEYFDDYKTGYDHKWDDLTIFEPHPVRVWKAWNFNLSRKSQTLNADIADSTKVTLAPDVADKLVKKTNGALAWPEIQSDSIFFSLAVLDHDKVIEHEPPYLGVWLFKDDDLIIETPTTADEDTLSVSAGHGYEFRNGQLNRVETVGCCQCDAPEAHDTRVTQMLRLHALVRAGEVLLLPHPLHIPGWYIAISA